MKTIISIFLLIFILGCSSTKETVIYWDNGNKAISYSLLLGKKEGKIISWDMEGNIIAEGVCKNDEFWNGSFIEWSTIKHREIIIAVYSEGKLIEVKPFSNNIKNAFFIGDTCTRKNSVIRIVPLEKLPDPPE